MNEPNCNSELESGLDVLIDSLRNPESLIYASGYLYFYY